MFETETFGPYLVWKLKCVGGGGRGGAGHGLPDSPVATTLSSIEWKNISWLQGRDCYGMVLSAEFIGIITSRLTGVHFAAQEVFMNSYIFFDKSEAFQGKHLGNIMLVTSKVFREKCILSTDIAQTT